IFLNFKGEESLTYNQLNERSNRFANGLCALGLSKGKKLTVMLPNCPEYLFLLFGAAKIGAVTVPVNTSYKGQLLSHVINNSDSELLIVDGQYLEIIDEIAEELPGLKTVLVYSSESIDSSQKKLLRAREVRQLNSLFDSSDEKSTVD